MSGVIFLHPSGIRFSGTENTVKLFRDAASEASVGEENSSRTSASNLRCRKRSIRVTANNEWPPNWKKLSCRPTRGTSSRSAQISANIFSVSLSGASYSRAA